MGVIPNSPLKLTLAPFSINLSNISFNKLSNFFLHNIFNDELLNGSFLSTFWSFSIKLFIISILSILHELYNLVSSFSFLLLI